MASARTLADTLARFGGGPGRTPGGPDRIRASLPDWLRRAGQDPRPLALAIALAVMGQVAAPLPAEASTTAGPRSVATAPADTPRDRIAQLDRFRANLEARHGRVTPSTYRELNGFTLMRAMRHAMAAARARDAGRHDDQLRSYLLFAETITPAIRARLGDEALAACWPRSPQDEARAREYESAAPGLARVIRAAAARPAPPAPAATILSRR